jgi:hypothetical protein
MKMCEVSAREKESMQLGESWTRRAIYFLESCESTVAGKRNSLEDEMILFCFEVYVADL